MSVAIGATLYQEDVFGRILSENLMLAFRELLCFLFTNV